MTRYAWRRLRHFVVFRVLHADDTPHRIAMGMAVGLFVGCSPLLGLHMVLALLGAVLLGGNRAVALAVVWLTNPITFAPVMAFNWMIGHAIMPRSPIQDEDVVHSLVRQLVGLAESFGGLIGRLFTGEFWTAVLQLAVKLGVELWIGSALVGLVAALMGYLFTYRAVIWRREHRRMRRERRRAQRTSRRTTRVEARAAGLDVQIDPNTSRQLGERTEEPEPVVTSTADNR